MSLGFVVIALLPAHQAEAFVTRIAIHVRQPFANGTSFGEVGPYEIIQGRFYSELDPAQPLNRAIIDLDRAPLNAHGRVDYSADFCILKPMSLARGNGALLYDAVVRGDKNALNQYNSARQTNDLLTTDDGIGNGFLMRHGFTVVWSGWETALPGRNDKLRIQLPIASNGRTRIEQQVWDEIVSTTAGDTVARLTFKVATLDRTKSTLLVRERPDGPATTVETSHWEFVDQQSIRLLPPGTPFRTGWTYEIIYPAIDPPLAGIGLAATRDFVSFLRHETEDARGIPNPLAVNGKVAMNRFLAHGSSQGGRYLLDFLYRGFNSDESGRRVFDGMNPHVAAARTFLNFRFAQPSRFLSLARGSSFYPDVTFPFAYDTQRDPFTGKRGGLLARCAAQQTCPKILHTASSTEYWQAGQSLMTTDPLGQRDAALPETVRFYLVAGTSHSSPPDAPLPRMFTFHLTPQFQINPTTACILPRNLLDLRPVLRALLLALDAWVKDSQPPPESRYPRLQDRTLVPRSAWSFPRIRGVPLPEHANGKPRLDYGPSYDHGIITQVPPKALGKSYAVLVPRVNEDGNEIAGIRLPNLAVPTGTATGWNIRWPATDGVGELCRLAGSYVPFAGTAAYRKAAQDPRLSIQERYGHNGAYLSALRAAADKLQREGYLLAEDMARILDAERRFPRLP